MTPRLNVVRDMKPGKYSISEVFQGLGGCKTLETVFGSSEEFRRALERTKVLIEESRGYMRVSDEDGTIIVNRDYLLNGSLLSIYLDIIHELTHVKQYLEGRELYDRSYAYVDRPTEVEAYAVVVKEAKKLGMNDEEIKDHLKVEWMSREEHERLAKRLGLMV